jgi:protein-arginine kinase activator protein McsA
MLCEKCHQKEATFHLTTILDGTAAEFHLCEDCPPPMGFDVDKLDLKKFEKVEPLSVVGKKCGFCGRDAFAGEMGTGGSALYWCIDCGTERLDILKELSLAERRDRLQRTSSWLASRKQRATQILRERRQQDGRNKDC